MKAAMAGSFDFLKELFHPGPINTSLNYETNKYTYMNAWLVGQNYTVEALLNKGQI